jgi:hypothetical protein
MPVTRSAFVVAFASLVIVACRPSLPHGQPGNVTFLWTFVSETCVQHPEIQSVHVIIPGEILDNAGYYPCTSAGFDGIVLHDFAAGDYQFQLEATDAQNQVLFVGSGGFSVNGNVGVNFDLVPAGELPSYAFLNWSFPTTGGIPNPTCAQAGITFVDLNLDGQDGHFACTDGTSTPGVQTPFLAAGHHTLKLVATDSTGFAYFGTDSTLDTVAGSPVSADFHLDWVVGGAVVQFLPYDGVTVQNCAQAGDPKVWVNFIGPNGPLFSGNGDGGPGNTGYDCGGVVTFNFLPDGQYKVVLYATGSGGTYSTPLGYEPQVTVAAGVFPTASDAVTVPMYKQ